MQVATSKDLVLTYLRGASKETDYAVGQMQAVRPRSAAWYALNSGNNIWRNYAAAGMGRAAGHLDSANEQALPADVADGVRQLASEARQLRQDVAKIPNSPKASAAEQARQGTELSQRIEALRSDVEGRDLRAEMLDELELDDWGI